VITKRIQRFYKEIWEEENRDVLPEICDSNFQFRGSLGNSLSGHEEFWDYLLRIRRALSDYRCTIEESVSEQNKVFAKMTFSGVHTGLFMGFAPTGS